MPVDLDFFSAKIFISHTNHDRLGKLVALGLERALRSKGLLPFLDSKSLEPSDDWRGKLATHLASCAGAVVVFTKNALEQKTWWVKHEAVVLLNRWEVARQNMGSFPLFFVLLDGVRVELRESQDDWNAILGPVNYMERQQPRNDQLPDDGDPNSNVAPSDDVSQEIARLASDIADKMTAQCVPLVDNVQVPGDAVWLGELINTMRKAKPEAMKTMDGQLSVVSDAAIHAYLGSELIRTVRRFRDEMTPLVGTRAAAERLYQLGKTVLGASTVNTMMACLEYFLADPAAAKQLHARFYPAGAGAPQRRALERLLLKDRRDVELHVRRGHMLPSRPLLEPISITNSGVRDELIASVRMHLDRRNAIAKSTGSSSTVVVYFNGPHDQQTHEALEKACAGYQFPLVWVVYGDAGEGGVIETAYDESRKQEELASHRCSAHQILALMWKNVTCCQPRAGAVNGVVT